MDTSAFWAGLWIITLAFWWLHSRWNNTKKAKLHKQISDTERELWLERKKNSDLMNERGDMRRGIIPPWPPVGDGWRLPVTYRGDTGDHD